MVEETLMLSLSSSSCEMDDSASNPNDSKSKNLECSYCKKKLSSRQNLKEHEDIHTGRRPYECQVLGCGAKFRQGSQLSIHKRNHLKVNMKKPEECERIIGLLLPPITLIKDATKIPNIFTIIRK